MAEVNKMNSLRFLPALMAAALICVALAAGLLVLDAMSSGAGHARETNELLALSQRIPLEADAALAGAANGFETLERSRTRFAALAAALGADVQGFEATEALSQQAGVVVAARESIENVRQTATDVRAIAPQLLQSLGNVAGAMGGLSPADKESIDRHLGRFELTSLRVQQDVEALVNAVDDPNAIARRLADGAEYLGQVVGALGGEDSGLTLPRASSAQAEAHYKQLRSLYAQLSERIRAAISSADRVRGAHAAARALSASAEQLYARPEGRAGAAASGSTPLFPGVEALTFALLVGGLIALALLTLLYAMTGNIRKTLQLHASKNERNQEAILRLLDELSSLADGDLTVQATVTEDITGAIADSINYAIEALRELVATINDSAVSLDAAAKETQVSAGRLAKASVAQSKQVALASESVAAMAASTEEVSGNAERSADVARHSVDVAHKGGEAVRRTMDGMNAIRGNVQETSQR